MKSRLNKTPVQCPGCGEDFIATTTDDYHDSLHSTHIECRTCGVMIEDLRTLTSSAKIDGWSAWIFHGPGFEFNVEGLSSREEAIEELKRWFKLRAFK